MCSACFFTSIRMEIPCHKGIVLIFFNLFYFYYLSYYCLFRFRFRNSELQEHPWHMLKPLQRDLRITLTLGLSGAPPNNKRRSSEPITLPGRFKRRKWFENAQGHTSREKTFAAVVLFVKRKNTDCEGNLLDSTRLIRLNWRYLVFKSFMLIALSFSWRDETSVSTERPATLKNNRKNNAVSVYWKASKEGRLTLTNPIWLLKYELFVKINEYRYL